MAERGRALRRWLVMYLLLALGAQADPLPQRLFERESGPRTYGYQVGDVLTRVFWIDVPSPWRLDESALPKPGRISAALDIRDLRIERFRAQVGERLSVQMDYQLFTAPASTRLITLPGVALTFTDGAKPIIVAVEPLIVAVSPLGPKQTQNRDGFGALQPDAPVPLHDTGRAQHVFWITGSLLAAIGLLLLQIYGHLPDFGRRSRPFARAYRRLRARHAGPEPTAQDFLDLHEAINLAAGRVVLSDSAEALTTAQPAFGALNAEIALFLSASQRRFFGACAGPGQPEPTKRQWLLGFARACRDIERGTRG